jgi:tRNA threonylcarbamoyladenosine biosynthesis protein TsaB
MRVLGIETTGEVCGVAVVDGEALLGKAVSEAPAKHVERTVIMIGDLLEEIAMTLGDLDGVAVSLGPGSFTGLRIGLGTAKGLCFGAGLPLVGVPTLDCMAENLCPWDGRMVPLRDARRGEVYLASYRSEGNMVERLSDYRALKPDRAAEEIAALAAEAPTLVAGDGLDRYGDFLRERVPAQVVFAPEERWGVDPAMVARIGLRMLRKGETLDIGTSEPLYLRPSEAERAARGLTGDGASSH